MCYWKYITPQAGGKAHGDTDRETQHVVTLIVTVTFDILPVKREKANQYCHSQLQIKLALLLLPPCSFFGAIQSAVAVTNASQSIVGEISELTSGMFFFSLSLPSLCFFPPKWTGSEAMEQNT